MATVNLGRIGFINKGVYASDVTYDKLDVVNYNNGIYSALKTVKGVTPTDDGVNWRRMVDASAAISAATLASESANTAAGRANTATTNANTATGNANTAAENANTAAESANTAADRANEVADTVGADVAQLKADNAKLKTEATIADYRIDNLEAAASGKLYREQVLSAESYSDSAYPDTVPYATLDKVGGKTLVWNQLIEMADTNTFKGIETVNLGNGYINIHGTLNENIDYNEFGISSKGLLKRDGRKYLIHKNKEFPYNWGINGYGATNNGNINSFIWTAQSSSDWVCKIFVKLVEGDTIDVDNLTCSIFDLTTMFGAGNEPTAEQFAAMFPADYYPYSEPTLMDFSTESAVSKGRNLVIGLLENTNIAAYGTLQELENFDMHYAPVVKGQTYTIRTNGSELVCGFFTDIPRKDSTSFDRSRIVDNNKTVTAPITGYIAFRTIGHYAEAQISVGTTELPYLPHRGVIGTNNLSALARKYFPDGMRSAGSVHDEIDLENKVAIKRVETGRFAQTLNWLQWMDNAYYSRNCGIQTINSFNDITITVESNYPSMTANDIYDQKAGIAVRDEAVYALGEMRNAIAGLKVNYILPNPVITPITEDIDPYIAVEGGGTVEFHNDHGDEYLVPVAHQMTYLIKTEA